MEAVLNIGNNHDFKMYVGVKCKIGFISHGSFLSLICRSHVLGGNILIAQSLLMNAMFSRVKEAEWAELILKRPLWLVIFSIEGLL